MELSCMAICVYQFLLIFSYNLTWGDQMHLLGKYPFIHSILLLTNIQKSSNLNYQTDKYSVKLQRTSKECGHTTMLLSFYVIYQNRKKSFWSHVYFLYSIGMYIFSNFSAKATVLFFWILSYLLCNQMHSCVSQRNGEAHTAISSYPLNPVGHLILGAWGTWSLVWGTLILFLKV